MTACSGRHAGLPNWSLQAGLTRRPLPDCWSTPQRAPDCLRRRPAGPSPPVCGLRYRRGCRVADQDKRKRKTGGGRPPTAATLLVQIATEMYDLRRTADSRSTGGDIVSEGHVYAVLKDDSSRRSELSDIREVIAEIYEMRHGSVP